MRHLRAFHEQFYGSKNEFSAWFDAPSDTAISDIFSGTFRVKNRDSRLTWKPAKNGPRDAVLFARAVGISTQYLNEVFVASDGRKFQDSALKPDRRKNANTPRPLPDIVKTVARFRPIDENVKSELWKIYGYNIAIL